jgi:membrane protein DedA with SNARE-associated domain
MGGMGGWDAFLDRYGLLAVFALLATKAAGVPVPIPADAIMLGAAAWAAAGRVALAAAFATVLLALLVGGLAQFGLARGPGRRVLYRFGRYLGLTPARLEAVAGTARRRGPIGLAGAMLLPGVRAVVVAACGVAGVPLARFLPALVLGSSLDVGLHFALGYLGGALLAEIGSALPALPALRGPLLFGAVVVLLALGLGAWLVIRRRQRPASPPAEVVAEAVASWCQATCPVCLALGAAAGAGGGAEGSRSRPAAAPTPGGAGRPFSD